MKAENYTNDDAKPGIQISEDQPVILSEDEPPISENEPPIPQNQTGENKLKSIQTNEKSDVSQETGMYRKANMANGHERILASKFGSVQSPAKTSDHQMRSPA